MKLSMKPFCIGLLGEMQCHSTRAASAQVRMALKVSSLPLLPTTIFGWLDFASNLASWRAPLTFDIRHPEGNSERVAEHYGRFLPYDRAALAAQLLNKVSEAA